MKDELIKFLTSDVWRGSIASFLELPETIRDAGWEPYRITNETLTFWDSTLDNILQASVYLSIRHKDYKILPFPDAGFDCSATYNLTDILGVADPKAILELEYAPPHEKFKIFFRK